MFVRLNEAAHPYIGHAELGIKLGFAIPFNVPAQNGGPDPTENETIADLEDTIIDAVAAATNGIHVLTLTAPEAKELVFYISEGSDIGSLHESLRAKSDTHDVQCMAVRDPEWESFREFSPQTEDGG